MKFSDWTLLLALALAGCAAAERAASPDPVRVLMITSLDGSGGPQSSLAGELDALEDGYDLRFDAAASLDELDDAALAAYDLLLLADPTAALPEDSTSPALTLTGAQRRAVSDFLAAGKGLACLHGCLGAFRDWDGFRDIVGGGLAQAIAWEQPVPLVVEEPGNPAVAHLETGVTVEDHILALDKNPRWNGRVLLSVDTEGLTLPGDVTSMLERNDYPVSWIRLQDGGRVFATVLGHSGAVWSDAAFRRHLVEGLRMAAGHVPADFRGHRVKEVIAEGVWPDDIAVDERGNVWIAELTGKVHRYDAATGETRVIGQIETTDPTKIEHGLFGIEVDPEFYDGSPYVYVYYAEPGSFVNVLARIPYRDGRLDLAAREAILHVPTMPNCCHQSGDLDWGPDGTLYLSTGDTGQSRTLPEDEVSEERLDAFVARNDLTGYHWSRLVDAEYTAQNLQSLRGKILRINKDGTIPKDNPFYGQTGVRWEVYALGLRNPYRFDVDANGDIYIGVVGPDGQYDYDEYDLSTRGGENFGWPRSFGRLFYNEWKPEMIDGYVPPIWEYGYEQGRRSASGGPVYRSDGPNAFPEVFQGKVFIYDWARGWIKWAELAEGSVATDEEADLKAGGYLHTFEGVPRLKNVKQFDAILFDGRQPISMELGPDGSLYVAEFDGYWKAGPTARVTRYRWVR